MMTPEQYNWHLNLVRDRYLYLDLNREQQEKLYQFENQPVYQGINSHYLSDWQTWDMELTFFRQILDPGQLEKYMDQHEKNKASLAESLRSQDAECKNELRHLLEVDRYYQEVFIPRMHSTEMDLLNWRIFYREREIKINFLRSEYKNWLLKYRSMLYESHFRSCRDLCPNQLKMTMLRLKVLHYVPDYKGFRVQMDEPTKAVAEFLEQFFRHFSLPNEDLQNQLEEELKAFVEASRKKHVEEKRGGWYVQDRTDPDTRSLYRKMSLLLMDPKGYDFSSPFLD